MQAAGYMNRERTKRAISVSESNIATLVISELKIVLTERVVDPVRYLDHGRALDVVTDRGI